MSEHIHSVSSATPERVAEALREAAARDAHPTRRPATTAERERFFGRLAELRKQAESS